MPNVSPPGFSALWQNLLITTSPVPPGWCTVGFVSHLLKLVDHCEFSHHPFVCSANWFCFEMRSQHMLHLAKLNMLMLCCCVKCLRTVSFRLPLVFGIIPPTFWKQILMVFFCFFLIRDATSHDNLDLCSPHPRKGQAPSPWGVPFGQRNMQVGGPHRLLHRTSASCCMAGSTCVASGRALI